MNYHNNGFAPIFIVLLSVIGTLAVLGASYGVYSYKKTANENVQLKEQIEAQKEEQTILSQEQNNSSTSEKDINLTGESKNATSTITSQKETKEKTPSADNIKGEVSTETSPSTSSSVITASDLSAYESGVVEISCNNSSGSGSLWDLGNNRFSVITNDHVVITPNYNKVLEKRYCMVDVRDSKGISHAILQIFPDEQWDWNDTTDVAVMTPVVLDIGAQFSQTPIPKLNFNLGKLRKCPSNIQVGAPVAIIGFPSSGNISYEAEGFSVSNSSKIITNGIISGFDRTVMPPFGMLPYPNYFVSAKIDSGNSGGIALSKDEDGLCVLGIPTWVNVGNYDTQGMIQNIHNVMSQ